jgi:hypothetical protein
MCFLFIHENRIMKPVEFVLKKEEKWGGRTMEEVNLTKI